MTAVARALGENLREAREAAGLSQEATGFRADLHRTEIGLLERGERTPRIDTVVKLAGAVGVPAATLLDGIEWEPGVSTAGEFWVPPSEAAKLARQARGELERRSERLISDDKEEE